jgi:hypothetical protein
VSIEPIVFIIELTTIATKSSQPIQTIVEPVQMENPQFSKFQLVLVFGHSIKTLR